MPYLAERRKYQRCDSIIYKAHMSTDEMRWENAEINDISAGGLSFSSHAHYSEGSKLHFNLYVYNMLSEFNIRLEGRIIRVDRSKSRKAYSVVFENINKYQQVQLDELIKSKITLKERKAEPVYEEEYSIFLFPRFKPAARRIKIYNYR